MAFTLPNFPINDASHSLSAALQRVMGARKEEAEAQGQENRNPYEARKAYAEAQSKLAYAALMGPQFMAKLLEHDNAFGSLKGSGKTAAIDSIGGAANAIASGGFGIGGDGDIPPIGNWQDVQRQQRQQRQQLLADGIVNYSQGTAMPDRSSAQPANISNKEAIRIANRDQALKDQSQPQQNYDYQEGSDPQSISDRRTGYLGPIYQQEGQAKEGGKLRAKQLDALDNDYKGYSGKQFVLNNLKQDLLSPILASVRTTPLMGAHEMNWFAKEGTPQQQEMIGRFMADTNNVITSSVKDFGSRMTNADLGVLMKMKINPNDTLDTAIGKYESLAAFNEYMAKKSSLVRDAMSVNPMLNQTKATEMVDKKLDGEQIRKNIQIEFYPVKVEHDGKTYKQTKDGWVPV